MNSYNKKFIIKTSIITLVIIALGFVGFKWFLPEYYLPVFWVAVVLFYVFTIAIHSWQIKMAKKNMAKFTRLSMVLILLKLLIYSAFTVIYLIIDSENAIPFVIVVMALYIIYSTTEVSSISKFTRSLPKNPE